MFLDVIVSFTAIIILIIGSTFYMVLRKKQYVKLHPPELSDYEKYSRRYEITGNEGDLQKALKALE